ncbi:MAG: NAD(P)/FAD-dependent oxidoreductase [Candidatus Omnitrophota bacterium]|jgi:predicted Rossmann fold flavoprotein|nr:MAG: NAD(P)/FAD-dependent oxidoreductase [Candidatus Omnitrophota bacterium]
MQKIIVIGAGPAGMMAAIKASQSGTPVTLIEQNPSLGKKLLISGKGRCNLTNAVELEQFLARFSNNGEFLRDAFKVFFNKELIEFFQSRGLGIKVERQQRVFPATDDSASIVQVLARELKASKVKIMFSTPVKDVIAEDGMVRGVRLFDNSLLETDRLIMATGGISYSFTGSDGKGIKIALRLGHRVVALRPGLVALDTAEDFIKDLAGITLKNIRLRFKGDKKSIVSDIGEILFTHTGISGPLVFTYSGRIVDWLKDAKEVVVEIDLKPALSDDQLNLRLLRDFKGNGKKAIKNVLKLSLPQRLISVFLSLSGIDGDKKISYISAEERKKLCSLFKSFTLRLVKPRPIEEAMITRGGVSLKDINPRTMESKIVKGLYFAGEMIDVDADTGGFNLQAAFSTGYLAGKSASAS